MISTIPNSTPIPRMLVLEDDNDDDEDEVDSQGSVEVRMIYKIGLGNCGLQVLI